MLITEVSPEGAAATARLKAGDVLVRYGDIEVTSVEKLGEEITAKAGEKEVSIAVWRRDLKSL